MKKLLMANEAAAHAALASGVGVVTGYPGTPSSEVVATVAHLHSEGAAQGVHVEWSTNEKAALEVAFGASLSGARALFTCKQMGLNVASDALLSLNYVGCRGGLVLYVADDPGPISSQTEQDTRRFAAFAKVPVLDPSTPEQLYDMVCAAFDLSEAFGTPVIVRPTTRICHASTYFDVPGSYAARPVPEGGFEKDDSRWVIFPARSFRAHREIDERLAAIASAWSGAGVSGARGGSLPQQSGSEPALRCASFNPTYQQGASPVRGVVAGGVSAAYVLEALSMFAHDKDEVLFKGHSNLARRGVDSTDPFAVRALAPSYRFLQVGTPYPFPEQAALRFLDGLSEVIVFEELDSVLEEELLKTIGRHRLGVRVFGKLDASTLTRGENSTEDAFARLADFFEFPVSANPLDLAHGGKGASDDRPTRAGSPAPEPPVRPPVLCAGCPHRGSFYAVKKALAGRPAVLCGDIGCYTLGNARPLDAVDTCLCMGAGITMAQGIAAAEPERAALAFVGDSTFFASGLTGVANAVYNNHNITICVLDNATTAMTGGQPHPGTGVTLMGGQSQPIDIEGALCALGVEHVVHADPFDAHAATEAAAEAIDFAGPSAVIFEGPCIQLSRPASPARVDTDACTGCGACTRAIGCPAMTVEGEKLRVDDSLCWGCNLCIQTCPFTAIKAGDTDA